MTNNIKTTDLYIKQEKEISLEDYDLVSWLLWLHIDNKSLENEKITV